MRGQRVADVGRPGRARQAPQLKRYLDQHALAVARDRGHEDGRAAQAGPTGDLGDVLVVERQCIAVERRVRAVRRGRILERGDQRLAAAGIARDGIDRDRAVGRSEENTSELQSLMRISYAVSCLKKKTTP